jgi:hypothetical protein
VLVGAVFPCPNNLEAFCSDLVTRWAAYAATSLGTGMSERKNPQQTDGLNRTPLVAERLLLLQVVLEGTERGASARMAERLGVTLHRWYNVLRGSPLSIGLAQQIVRKFPGVSLDWLYLGRPEGLSWQTAEKLGVARGGSKVEDRADISSATCEHEIGSGSRVLERSRV